MKTGDLVHVPADVTLIRNISCDYDLLGVKHFKTKVPKKAIFIEHLDSNKASFASGATGLCYIEYGEHTWIADNRDIKLVEYENDC
tara:strand:+ start:2058 stop:2315 length:258 start_codon:yes stop_codon:yes gene_type:complete